MTVSSGRFCQAVTGHKAGKLSRSFWEKKESKVISYLIHDLYKYTIILIDRASRDLSVMGLSAETSTASFGCS